MRLKNNRRALLKCAAAAAASALAGCRWESDTASPMGAPPETAAAPAPAPAPPPAEAGWTPYVPPMIVGSKSTFDLSATLPAGVARGGTFGVDATGARLPTGMSLSANGILAVGAAAAGSIVGVIFTYDEP